MSGRRKSRMNRVRETENPNFEETKKSENKRDGKSKERRKRNVNLSSHYVRMSLMWTVQFKK